MLTVDERRRQVEVIAAPSERISLGIGRSTASATGDPSGPQTARPARTGGNALSTAASAPGGGTLLRRLGFCGSRSATERGLAVAADMAEQVAGHDLNVVSGGAKGVDITAHRTALSHGGAPRRWSWPKASSSTV